MPGRKFQQGTNTYRFGLNGQEKSTEVNGDGNLYTAKYWQYDSRIGRRWNVDPLASKFPHMSPYVAMDDNPIKYADPTGAATDDFVKDNKTGQIHWDNKANSQATTKAGETYLGKTLTFKFNSYIDKKLWDGPLGSIPAGDKLTTTVYITGNENAKGELTSVSAGKHVKIGWTPTGTARDYYPGLGNDQNKFSITSSPGGVNVNMEQHASVSTREEFGMNVLGYKIVNVAQKLDISIPKTGNLSISTATDIFPSANFSVNGASLMQYNQPSFVGTHSAPIIGTTITAQSGEYYLTQPIYDLSLKPAMWYKR